MSYFYTESEDAFILIDDILSDNERIISCVDLMNILFRMSLDLSEDCFNEESLPNPDPVKIAFNDGQCNIAMIVHELLKHVKVDN